MGGKIGLVAENEKTKYCYREVDFYRDGFIAVVFVRAMDGNEQMIHAMMAVYKNLKESRVFKIIQVKNRINTPNRDYLVNMM